MIGIFFGGFKREDIESKRNKENIVVKYLRDGWVMFKEKIKII